MAIKVPHDGSSAYRAVGRNLAAGTIGQNLRLLAYRAGKESCDLFVIHFALLYAFPCRRDRTWRHKPQNCSHEPQAETE